MALYGRYGDAVINVYNPNARDEENLQAMTAEVYRQGPRNVSKHCMTAEEYKKLNNYSHYRIYKSGKIYSEFVNRYIKST